MFRSLVISCQLLVFSGTVGTVVRVVIHENTDDLSKRIKALEKLKGASVKVGLPENAGGRLQFILAVQEHGSPVMRIPSRPVIKPGLAREETRAAMAEEMKAAVQAAWEGNEDEARPP